MSTVITAANATNGMSFTPDNTAALEFKTGSGAGTTALTLSSSQIATFSTGVGLPTGLLYPLVSATAKTTTTTSFTGSTSGVSTTLTAASVTGTIQIGQVIAGTGIVAGTSIIAQVSGTTGGAGTYTLSQASSGTVSGTITFVGIDFTGIPSTAKRITVMFNGVSTSGTSPLQIQIGAGSVTTSGYLGVVSNASTTVATETRTSGLPVMHSAAQSADAAVYGNAFIALQNTNAWVENCVVGKTGAVNVTCFGGGSITLSGTLDRVRITTVNGTDTFDAGSINIMWE